MHISELDTPALLIDLDVMERNLERAARYATEHNLRLRPHTKTHKIPALARKQIELGAAGITVAKTTEAEVMLAADPPDLLVAYPVVGKPKVERLIDVARRVPVTVSLDNETSARAISAAAEAAGVRVQALAEMDVGLGRVGVAPGEELVALGRMLASLPGLELRGIAFYAGHIKKMDEQGFEQLEELAETVERAVADFRRAGLPTGIVSGGSTPTLYQSHRIPAMNEIRPGTYIFNDRNCVACGCATWEDCAASILVTVVSTARGDRMIVDGGSKTFFSDSLATGEDPYFGRVLEAPEARFVKMNEEHGYIDLEDAAGRFQVGDRVRIVPNHICVAMNLHEKVYGVRDGEVVEEWAVAGRGKLQ